ncbi:MAG: helix-turn-helix domain-containing protein [Alphaproteobacteria bacterium]
MVKKLKNPLNDYEVGIIKNLVSKPDKYPYKDQEILGWINNQRLEQGKQPINSGRISNIKNNQIKKYKDIQRATDEETDEFLKKSQAPKTVDNNTNDPLNEELLDSLITVSKDNPNFLSITETHNIEFKASINISSITFAAFANNMGGYIICGVKDSREVIGVENKLPFDLRKFNQQIKKDINYEIKLNATEYTICGKKIFIVYVFPSDRKPIIFSQKDIEDDHGNKLHIPEGKIYYRYSAENRLIGAHELQKIIEQRIDQRVKELSSTTLIKHLSNIVNNGIENSAILNITTGEVSGKGGNFLIDESLLEKIKFIKDGHFVERDGAPTLRLMGNLQPISGIGITTIQEIPIAINEESLIKIFIEQNKTDHPKEFIKQLGTFQASWSPIFYFMQLASLDAAETLAILQSGGCKEKNYKHFKEWLGGEKKIPSTSKSNYSTEIHDIIEQKEFWIDSNVVVIKKYFKAVLSLENKQEINEKYAFLMLNKCFYPLYSQKDHNIRGLYRSVLCKIDELFFRPSASHK